MVQAIRQTADPRERIRLLCVLAAGEMDKQLEAFRPRTGPTVPRPPINSTQDELDRYKSDAAAYCRALSWVEGENAGRLQTLLFFRAHLIDRGEHEPASIYERVARQWYRLEGVEQLPTDRREIRELASQVTQMPRAWRAIGQKRGKQ